MGCVASLERQPRPLRRLIFGAGSSAGLLPCRAVRLERAASPTQLFRIT
jgi:hypothetical protein